MEAKKGLIIGGSIFGGLLLIFGIAKAVGSKNKTTNVPPIAPSGDDTTTPTAPDKTAWFQTGMNLFGAGKGAVAGTAAKGTKIKIDNFDTKKDGNYDLVIALSSPRPAKGAFKGLDKIKLEGMGVFDGTYSIPLRGIWIDGSGNVGGISLKTKKATYDALNQKRGSATITKV